VKLSTIKVEVKDERKFYFFGEFFRSGKYRLKCKILKIVYTDWELSRRLEEKEN